MAYFFAGVTTITLISELRHSSPNTWLNFDNHDYLRESKKSYRVTYKELMKKEIEGPGTLNFIDYDNIHNERALQELDEFYRAKIVNEILDDSDEEADTDKARRAQEENEGSNFKNNPQTYSIAPSTTPTDPFSLFGNPEDVPSTSRNPGSDMDDE
ncbi:hypothetical protein Tco_0627560 [Tanacetum coccineum]|uniref:Uncharacterized protein n=1 Tax=Tanacetum coccineum TaxID=301880 RepID=A0ABQ4WMY8_9ASTR